MFKLFLFISTISRCVSISEAEEHQSVEGMYIKLNSGYMMPMIGFGTSNVHKDDVERTLDNALETGYRGIDTAYAYKNEVEIGRVLRKWLISGKISRDDIFVTTKLPGEGMHPTKVREYLERSLRRLGLSYVDLYLIHSPIGKLAMPLKSKAVAGSKRKRGKHQKLDLNTDLEGIWLAMEDQVREGRIRSIGLSNFNISQIERISRMAAIQPANVQVEVHAYFQQLELQEFCKEKGISLTAYATLGSEQLQTRRNKYFMPLLTNPLIMAVARSRKRTPAQVLLRYSVQQGVAVIPKSIQPGRIKTNFQIYDFSLTSQEMDTLRSLDRWNGRAFVYKSGCDHPEHPFPSHCVK